MKTPSGDYVFLMHPDTAADLIRGLSAKEKWKIFYRSERLTRWRAR